MIFDMTVRQAKTNWLASSTLTRTKFTSQAAHDGRQSDSWRFPWPSCSFAASSQECGHGATQFHHGAVALDWQAIIQYY